MLVVEEETPVGPILEAIQIALALPAGARPEIRLQQRQFIFTCAEGVWNSRDVVIEGPTGLGKTRSILAAVIPLLLADETARVLFLSRTITQVDNILREIEDICRVSEAGRNLLSSVAVFGVAHMRSRTSCWTPRRADVEPDKCSTCQRNSAGRRVSEVDGLEERIAGIVPERNFGAEQYRKFHEATGGCPLRLMEFGTRRSRIVVATHHRIHDSAWLNNWFGELGNTVVVIDEAHNYLADATSSAFLQLRSGEGRLIPTLQDNAFAFEQGAAEEEPRRDDRQAKYDLDAFLRRVFDQIISIAASAAQVPLGGDVSGKFLLEDCFQLRTSMITAGIEQDLEAIERLAGELIDESDRSGYSADNCQAYRQLVSTLQIVLGSPYEFFAIFEPSTGSLSFWAIHPRVKSGYALRTARCCLFTSATIAPVQDVAALLGRGGALQVRVGHMFPAENYKHFFVLGAHSSSFGADRELMFSEAEAQTIGNTLEACVSAAAGRNIGIFCSSRNVMHHTIELVRRRNLFPDDVIAVGDLGAATTAEDGLGPGAGGSRDRFGSSRRWLADGWLRLREYLGWSLPENASAPGLVEPFKEMQNHPVTTVLFAVQGGSLSEGVDYKGKAMEMVINIGLPYPASAAEVQLAAVRRDYWGMQFDKEENFDVDDITYRQEAFRKLAQSAGRGHRTKDDRAVIVFVDERLLALKNDGEGGYERLSVKTAKKNLQLLQEPLQQVHRNVVVDPANLGLIRAIRSRSGERGDMMFTPEDVTDFEAMHQAIAEFYEGKNASLIPENRERHAG